MNKFASFTAILKLMLRKFSQGLRNSCESFAKTQSIHPTKQTLQVFAIAKEGANLHRLFAHFRIFAHPLYRGAKANAKANGGRDKKSAGKYAKRIGPDDAPETGIKPLATSGLHSRRSKNSIYKSNNHNELQLVAADFVCDFVREMGLK